MYFRFYTRQPLYGNSTLYDRVYMQWTWINFHFIYRQSIISIMAWRFKTSKYKNAAPKVIKREVKIDLHCFIFKNLTQNINNFLHPSLSNVLSLRKILRYWELYSENISGMDPGRNFSREFNAMQWKPYQGWMYLYDI